MRLYCDTVLPVVLFVWLAVLAFAPPGGRVRPRAGRRCPSASGPARMRLFSFGVRLLPAQLPRGQGLCMNRKERTGQLRMGGYQGGIPLIKIRRSGVYVTEAKLRSNLFLTDLPPGGRS